MDLIKINQEIYITTQELGKGSKNLFPYAKKYAEAEKNYRNELAKEIIKLKCEKYPAVLISDLARGNVAELKFKRDLAKLEWDAAVNSLKAISTQMSGLQSILRNQSEV